MVEINIQRIQSSIGYVGVIGLIFLFGIVSILLSIILINKILSTLFGVFGTTMVAISVISLVYEYFMTERFLSFFRKAFPHISDPNELPHDLRINILHQILLSLSPSFLERDALDRKFIGPLVDALETTIRRDMRFDLSLQKDDTHSCSLIKVDGSYRLENIANKDICWTVPFIWSTVKIPDLDRNDHIVINALIVDIEGEQGERETHYFTDDAQAIDVIESDDPNAIEPMSLVIPEEGEFMVRIPKGKTAHVRYSFQVYTSMEDELKWRMADFTEKIILKIRYDPTVYRISVGEFCFGDRKSLKIGEGEEEHEWDTYFLPKHGIFVYWILRN